VYISSSGKFGIMCAYFRKTSFIVACILLFSSVHSQTVHKGDQILFWKKGERLTFADFQGNPYKGGTIFLVVNATTLTHTLGSISKSIDVRIKTEKGRTVFGIYAGMKKNLSWIRDEGDTISLKHEQGHFDICEIYARILRRDVKHAKTLAEAKAMFERISTDEEREHDDYDKENTFRAGGITSLWRNKIRGRLKELDAYWNPFVVVAIVQ
jgi:hypothetical protein